MTVRDRSRSSWFGTRPVTLLLAGIMVIAACTSSGGTEETTPPGANTTASGSATTRGTGGCADVVDATIEPATGGFRVSATLLTADTGWEEYADAWEVRAPDGTVLGTRVLAHPHVDEQPFTRSLSDVVIPETITTVEIAAGDLVEGFCGENFEIPVPGR